MKKLFLALGLLATIFLFLGGVKSNDFFAKILRDGDYLLNLVNKQNSLQEYRPNDLADLSTFGASGKYIRQTVHGPLSILLSDANKSGVPVKILSAYRSYERQKSTFSFWSSKYEDAGRFSAEAGHSEHQLGTTIDFGLGRQGIDLTSSFGDTPEGKWLSENAWKYGFVMSYPRNKEEVTGYIYEPWHFRFIGSREARRLHDLNLSGDGEELTLSEYLATKPQYYRLIRLSGDYRIYSIDTDGAKHWIETSEKFLSLGYDWSDVVVVTGEEFELYPTGGTIQ